MGAAQLSSSVANSKEPWKNQYIGVASYIFQVIYIVFKGFYTRKGYTPPNMLATNRDDMKLTSWGSGISRTKLNTSILPGGILGGGYCGRPTGFLSNQNVMFFLGETGAVLLLKSIKLGLMTLKCQKRLVHIENRIFEPRLSKTMVV